MKFGILREGKNPPDKRVPFTPEHCAALKAAYPTLEIVVQTSAVRAITDTEYEEVGIPVVESVADCDVLWGVKEVNISELIAGKTYLFFSHTYKKQAHNRALLQALVSKRIRMIDYELLVNPAGNRVVAFGRYAGIVGAYNGLRGVGLQTGAYQLQPAHTCFDMQAMFAQLQQLRLPNNYKIAITGSGRVSGGAQETLNQAGIKKVTPDAFLHQTFTESVYTVLEVDDYVMAREGAFDKQQFYAHPEEFTSNFMRFAKVTDLYIPCHFWDSKAPFLFTRADAQHPDFNIQFVADVSCDVNGPVASTLRASTIAAPFYGYDPQTAQEVPFGTAGSIGVMAIDNLPCELPRDASRDFGRDLMAHVVPQFFNNDAEGMLSKATETADGALTPKFAYLTDFLNGN